MQHPTTKKSAIVPVKYQKHSEKGGNNKNLFQFTIEEDASVYDKWVKSETVKGKSLIASSCSVTPVPTLQDKNDTTFSNGRSDPWRYPNVIYNPRMGLIYKYL